MVTFYSTARACSSWFTCVSIWVTVIQHKLRDFNITVNRNLFHTGMVLLILLDIIRTILEAINVLSERAEANKGLQL